MCLIEIACLVFGIIVLVRGRVPLSANKEVRGAPAYLVGLLLAAVFPLALLIGLVVGFQRAQNGQPVNIQQPDLSLVLIDVGVVAGCGITALVIALATAQPKKNKRRRRAQEEDYDDYDREEDDEHDRPRRRRYDELEDEEGDRPRRRARDEDDDRYH